MHIDGLLLLCLALVLQKISAFGYSTSTASINQFRRQVQRLPASSNPYERLESERDDSLSGGIVLPIYDGEEIQQYYSKHLLEVWERMIDIGSPIMGWWVLRQWDKFTNPFQTIDERERRKNQRAVDLKDAIIQGQSITFIKSGQALSLRPDLVKSPEYIRELACLQDEVGTFPTEVAMGIIKDEFLREGILLKPGAGVKGPTSVEDLYTFDPPDPIASASIGQVFCAICKDSGERVAVKVQRPDAQITAPVDMFIIRNLASTIKKRFKLRSNLVAIADEFGSQIYSELNYEQEARNCLRFRNLYGEVPGIFIPDVRTDLTTRRVLTQEWVQGEKGPWAEDGEKMLTVGLQCSVLQLLGTGYFHSDPHRGNLLKTENGELAYLDFGMMSEVPAKMRFALIGTVLGLVNKDIPLVIENMKKLEFLPDETQTDVVVEALSAAVIKSTTDGSGRGSSLNFTALNRNINEMSYLLPIQLPPFYTLIIRTLTILEGLALSVDPKFRLVKGAYPFIAKQILSNQGKTASSPAKQILSNQGKTASSPLKSAAYTEEREMEREREWEREGERSGRGRGSGSAADRMAWSAGLGAASAEGLEASAEMNKLLTSIMINKNTGRIRWDKLEQFVSISANADKALAGDFSALQSAQSRADLLRTYSDPSGYAGVQGKAGVEDNSSSADSVEVTEELVLQILDFLLSSNGDFIREPLVDEIVDTLEALGLTAAQVLSLATGLPGPSQKPDRARVESFLAVLSSFAGPRVDLGRGEVSVTEGLRVAVKLAQRLLSVLQNSEIDIGIVTGTVTGTNTNTDINAEDSDTTSANSSSSSSAKISKVLQKATPLLRQIGARLAAKSVRQATREILGARTIRDTLLPALSNVLDLAARASRR